MIKSQQQYRIAIMKLRRLARIRQQILRRPAGALDIRPRNDDLAKVDELSVQLQMEINEFDELRRQTLEIPELDLSAELPTHLIRARIAAGWTQQELAASCGLRREVILRYEKDNYRLATMETVIRASIVLSSALREKRDKIGQLEKWLQERHAQAERLSSSTPRDRL